MSSPSVLFGFRAVGYTIKEVNMQVTTCEHGMLTPNDINVKNDGT